MNYQFNCFGCKKYMNECYYCINTRITPAPTICLDCFNPGTKYARCGFMQMIYICK